MFTLFFIILVVRVFLFAELYYIGKRFYYQRRAYKSGKIFPSLYKAQAIVTVISLLVYAYLLYIAFNGPNEILATGIITLVIFSITHRMCFQKPKRLIIFFPIVAVLIAINTDSYYEMYIATLETDDERAKRELYLSDPTIFHCKTESDDPRLGYLFKIDTDNTLYFRNQLEFGYAFHKKAGVITNYRLILNKDLAESDSALLKDNLYNPNCKNSKGTKLLSLILQGND